MRDLALKSSELYPNELYSTLLIKTRMNESSKRVSSTGVYSCRKSGDRRKLDLPNCLKMMLIWVRLNERLRTHIVMLVL